jgi:hypothetical protein
MLLGRSVASTFRLRPLPQHGVPSSPGAGKRCTSEPLVVAVEGPHLSGKSTFLWRMCSAWRALHPGKPCIGISDGDHKGCTAPFHMFPAFSEDFHWRLDRMQALRSTSPAVIFVERDLVVRVRVAGALWKKQVTQDGAEGGTVDRAVADLLDLVPEEARAKAVLHILGEPARWIGGESPEDQYARALRKELDRTSAEDGVRVMMTSGLDGGPLDAMQITDVVEWIRELLPKAEKF